MGGDIVSQSDGKNRLKRMEFEYKGRTYPFAVNPEEYTQEEPSRSLVTQTLGGAWVDDFGGGLPVISIRGNTGFRNGMGFQKFKELRDLIRSYYKSNTVGQSIEDELVFHNFTDEESWVVHTDPTGFRLLRSKNNPLLYMYEIRLICLRPATHPNTNRTEVGNVRNYNSSLSTNFNQISATIRQQLSVQSTQPTTQVSNFITNLTTLSDGRVFNAPTATATVEYEPSFTPYISQAALQTKDQLQKQPFTNPLSQFPYTVDDTLGSSIQQLTKQNLPIDLITALRMVLLESYTLYSLLQSVPDTLDRYLSYEELQRISENLDWIANTFFSRVDIEYLLSEKLRRLARIFDTVKRSNVYEPYLQTELDSYLKTLGGDPV